MKSKTIIINSEKSVSSRSGRGILTLFQEYELLQCRLRLYNVEKLSKYCKIGIYHKEQVYSANLLEKNGVYESSLVGNFNIDEDFYAAIIDTNNNNQVILSGGTYAGFYFNDTSVFNQESKLNEPLQNKERENNCVNCEKCKNCKYKEFFFNSQQLENFTTETVSTQDEQKDLETTESEIEYKNHSILESIIPQFNYIFENYNPDEELNSLLPNAKFVKINNDKDHYSIGAMYDNDTIKYICYAVKCDYNVPAPEELGEHYQWLPIDKEDPLSEGFYIVFQDAKDLKILKL